MSNRVVVIPPVRTKPDLLRQLADMAYRIRKANAICPHWFAREVKDFEDQLAEVEADIASQIDALMSSRLNTYNAAQHPRLDRNGLSGRWGEKRSWSG